jgi:hypothetical protein
MDVDATLVWGCAEDILGTGVFSPDLIITSPPYFDAEHYSKELTQSYLRYPTREAWFDLFLGRCIRGAFSDLRSKGHLILNVGLDMVGITVELAVNAGFRLVKSMDLLLGTRPSRSRRGRRHESILVMRKD